MSPIEQAMQVAKPCQLSDIVVVTIIAQQYLRFLQKRINKKTTNITHTHTHKTLAKVLITIIYTHTYL